jgi:hypothetical protein
VQVSAVDGADAPYTLVVDTGDPVARD